MTKPEILFPNSRPVYNFSPFEKLWYAHIFSFSDNRLGIKFLLKTSAKN
jgi:hypothetical protein